MVDKLNIYQKLVEVRKGIATFKKDTIGYNFRYVSGTQVLSAIKGDLDKHGIILEQHLTAPEVDGTLVRSPMKMVWVNADDPTDRIEINWFMVGKQKDPSQSFGSGLTYAERYFMLKFFNVPTDDDDPDKKNKGNGKSGKPAIKPDDMIDPETDPSAGEDYTELLSVSERPITDKQLKFYHVQVREANVEADKFSDRVKKQFGIKSKKELMRWQFDKVIGSLEEIIKKNSQGE